MISEPSFNGRKLRKVDATPPTKANTPSAVDAAFIALPVLDMVRSDASQAIENLTTSLDY
jgi:hypothetical protein